MFVLSSLDLILLLLSFSSSAGGSSLSFLIRTAGISCVCGGNKKIIDDLVVH